jgi:hypothetical protein
MILNYLKMKFNLGQFKQKDFIIRKHNPKLFTKELKQSNFKVIEDVYFGFNALPSPLNIICSNKINEMVNIQYNKNRNRYIKALGEGYLVLCKSNKPRMANDNILIQ